LPERVYLGSALHQSGGDGLAYIDWHGQAPHLRKGHPSECNSIHDSIHQWVLHCGSLRITSKAIKYQNSHTLTAPLSTAFIVHNLSLVKLNYYMHVRLNLSTTQPGRYNNVVFHYSEHIWPGLIL